MPTPPPSSGPLLRGADRAVLVVALAERLRARGVPVTMTAMRAFADALAAAPPAQVPRLYWLARLTLVKRAHDLETFDRVFHAAFAEAVLEADPQARRTGVDPPPAPEDAAVPVPGHRGAEDGSGGMPWHTLPRPVAEEEDEAGGHTLPELMPSAVARIADTPLERLDEDELALLGRWLEASAHRWPTRRSRRLRVRPTGRRVALRETVAASRHTGWEPMELKRYHHVTRPLTVTLVCDLSGSMQACSTAYLHLMRAFARTGRAEAFAFSTSLTRLTPALTNRSAEAAVAQANDLVTDRFGGTHLAGCLRELLASRHGNALRGGVLVVASDGWDSDDPAALAAVLARVARRTRRIVWLNPRAAAAGFEPLVGSMAAALPYCDVFLPAHTLRALPEVFDAIAGAGPARLSLESRLSSRA